MELKNIPDGTVVHNIELTAGKGGPDVQIDGVQTPCELSRRGGVIENMLRDTPQLPSYHQ